MLIFVGKMLQLVFFILLLVVFQLMVEKHLHTFFAIIRTEEMKRQNLYRFKLLKQRDGDFLKSQIRLNLNSTYLTLENDQFLDQ